MSTYESQTIKETLDDINTGKLIIPALQRNFVWPENKITDLFDSLVRGYPIGTFLFWDVDKQGFENYTFNKILINYKEAKNKKYRGEKADADRTEYCAVLDGQQRITSLALGIIGKYTIHKKNTLWDDDSNYVDEFLCLNILHEPSDSDDKYEFKFKSDENINIIIHDDKKEDYQDEYWIKVSDVYNEDGIFNPDNNGIFGFLAQLESLDDQIFTLKKRVFINNLLLKLRTTLIEKEVVSVYTTPSNLKLDEVVDIFVRVNSGGQKLDDADLILSIASGENTEDSFYDKISNAIEDIQAISKDFRCDKKFILSVALLAIGAESLSLKRPENYSRDTINKIIASWDKIVDSIKSAIIFVDKLQFETSKLSLSLFIPIIYYFYKSNRNEKYFESVSSRRDRIYIRQWIFRTMINGVFDEGTGKTLIRMRSLLDEAWGNGKKYYPLDAFMEKAIKKPLLIQKLQINEILDWKYPDYRIIPFLMEISPSLPEGKYSRDHIWPRDYLTTKKKLEAATPNKTDAERSDMKSRCDYLPNIQLITSNENSQKNELFFESWIDNFYSDDSKRKILFDRNIIPIMEKYDFEQFIPFFAERAKLIETRIIEAFPDTIAAIDKRYNL